MKIELDNKKIVFNNSQNKTEIHPVWLRERVSDEKYLDKNNDQRLFDPSFLNNINIENAKIDNNFLELTFNDGVTSKFDINKLTSEFLDLENLSNTFNQKLWDSSLKNYPTYEFKEKFFDSKEMYQLLKSFYEYGFVMVKKVPTQNNYIVDFANSIGSIRPTNFGEFFNVRSVPNPNDLAYTSLALSPHTDNPYRKPVPCIQLLHCIENEVKGGYSTLVDGFKVANHLRKNNPEYFEILTKIKVKFKFTDKNVILENKGELIELDEKNNFKQIRFSTRLDYVPPIEKNQLDVYYRARKEISNLYNSKKYKIEFKLMPGDLIMMDNHRLLHGRTAYNANEGKRFLQGCYIDHDSSEGKLRHLKRKFDL
ncbi:TauD/TfdA family dioxygenase [Pelagibacteraceae bacterium]|nr:TauD/TfdA family dioxygenase [Candidatus Pelagibacter sp.]MDC1485417.1 TauD/TfdA family dioxygenase [Pelagibacteraceae bacterium]